MPKTPATIRNQRPRLRGAGELTVVCAINKIPSPGGAGVWAPFFLAVHKLEPSRVAWWWPRSLTVQIAACARAAQVRSQNYERCQLMRIPPRQQYSAKPDDCIVSRRTRKNPKGSGTIF